MLAPEILVARFLLGCLFIIASLGKLRNPPSFAEDIAEYRLLPGRLVTLVAYLLPLGELLLGIDCLIGLALPLVMGAMILLLLVFTGAVSINLLRGHRIRCHCFGGSSTLISPLVLVRNGVLLAIAGWLLFNAAITLNIGSMLNVWQTDIHLLINLDTAAPILASVVLSLGLLFLLNEVNPAFLQLPFRSPGPRTFRSPGPRTISADSREKSPEKGKGMA